MISFHTGVSYRCNGSPPPARTMPFTASVRKWGCACHESSGPCSKLTRNSCGYRGLGHNFQWPCRRRWRGGSPDAVTRSLGWSIDGLTARICSIVRLLTRDGSDKTSRRSSNRSNQSRQSMVPLPATVGNCCCGLTGRPGPRSGDSVKPLMAIGQRTSGNLRWMLSRGPDHRCGCTAICFPETSSCTMVAWPAFSTGAVLVSVIQRARGCWPGHCPQRPGLLSEPRSTLMLGRGPAPEAGWSNRLCSSFRTTRRRSPTPWQLLGFASKPL